MSVMRTTTIDIKKRVRNKTAYEHLSGLLRNSKALYNHAQFYIRNTQAGLRKSPENRTANETEVLHDVFTGIQKANITKELNFRKRLKRSSGCHWKMASLFKKSAPLQYPSSDSPYLDYSRLDVVFRENDDPVYYSLPAQANQQVLKKACLAWKSYFKAVGAYHKNPSAFTGFPKRPGYNRDLYATAYLTNQICRYRSINGRGYILLPGTKQFICTGPACSGRYVKTEIRFAHGHFRILVTFEQNAIMPELPKHPSRILGIDTGLDNFMSCTPNTGRHPFIYDGSYLKSMNAYYNKRMARLRSAYTEGTDNPCRTVTKRMMAISDRRESCFRDYFYKLAHHICRICQEDHIGVIVCGHNEKWKQDVDTGKRNNQNFVCIPYSKFFQILRTVAVKYKIHVVETEESYTSKASLIDLDDIPVYQKNDGTVYQFSGCRVKRGLYQTGNTYINADINAAGNIIRKLYPYAFDGFDFHALTATVDRYTAEDILHGLAYTKRSGYAHKRSGCRMDRHNGRAARKKVYLELFKQKKSTQYELSA